MTETIAPPKGKVILDMTAQPSVVYLRRAAHRIPIGNSIHKYIAVDKIVFDCPLHSPEYEDEAMREAFAPIEETQGLNAGMIRKGHHISLYARAGTSYKYKHKSGRIFYIYGYTINGTQITITPQIVGTCSFDARLSDELYQETSEMYWRPVGYTDNYVSAVEGLTATVREV